MLCAVHTKKEQLHRGNIISFSLWVAIFTCCRFVVHTTCIVLHQWTISDTWTTKHIFVIIFSYLLLLFIIWCDMHLTATAVALNIPSDTMSRSHSACRATLGYSLHHHSWKCYLSDCETLYIDRGSWFNRSTFKFSYNDRWKVFEIIFIKSYVLTFQYIIILLAEPWYIWRGKQGRRGLIIPIPRSQQRHSDLSKNSELFYGTFHQMKRWGK